MTNTSPFDRLAIPAIATINHLLAQEEWARTALARHAGKVARVDTGAFALRFKVAADGMFVLGEPDDSVAVTIRMKLADLPLIARDMERAFSYVQVEGDAEMANTLSKLANGLRWEAEHDLEPFVGTIAARRIVQGVRGAVGAVGTTQRKVAENVAEFLVEEQPLLVKRAEADEFASDVRVLRDDIERAEKRIAKLERRLAAGPANPPAAGAGQQSLDLE